MKTCPFCAEEIQEAAIKCKHCGEFLDQAKVAALQGSQSSPQQTAIPNDNLPAIPWYCKTSTLVITAAFVGPFVIPLFFLHPSWSMPIKITLSVVVLVLTVLLGLATMELGKQFMEAIKQLQQF